ncbi:hypothetical protein [Alkalihalobacillus sp. CinArs1]|uniref:hypothetical protein n=1 Tax=Alkalihalobacillus sp. CinArs1 TaxID=2995314 RepID=UPI0022DD5EA5|nr:hypothetical protein [Alkalihalobacillus sp. CinArs1]
MSGIGLFFLIVMTSIISLAFYSDHNRKKRRVSSNPKPSFESRSAASMFVIASIEERVDISPEERSELDQLDVEGILAFAVAREWLSSNDESSIKDQLHSTKSEPSFDSSYVETDHTYGGSGGYDSGGGFDGGGGGE